MIELLIKRYTNKQETARKEIVLTSNVGECNRLAREMNIYKTFVKDLKHLNKSVKPTYVDTVHIGEDLIGYFMKCGNCDYTLYDYDNYKYCPECGVKIMWRKK